MGYAAPGANGRLAGFINLDTIAATAVAIGEDPVRLTSEVVVHEGRHTFQNGAATAANELEAFAMQLEVFPDSKLLKSLGIKDIGSAKSFIDAADPYASFPKGDPNWWADNHDITHPFRVKGEFRGVLSDTIGLMGMINGGVALLTELVDGDKKAFGFNLAMMAGGVALTKLGGPLGAVAGMGFAAIYDFHSNRDYYSHVSGEVGDWIGGENGSEHLYLGAALAAASTVARIGVHIIGATAPPIPPASYDPEVKLPPNPTWFDLMAYAELMTGSYE
jgi:hypothetical protein